MRTSGSFAQVFLLGLLVGHLPGVVLAGAGPTAIVEGIVTNFTSSKVTLQVDDREIVVPRELFVDSEGIRPGEKAVAHVPADLEIETRVPVKKK